MSRERDCSPQCQPSPDHSPAFRCPYPLLTLSLPPKTPSREAKCNQDKGMLVLAVGRVPLIRYPSTTGAHRGLHLLSFMCHLEDSICVRYWYWNHVRGLPRVPSLPINDSTTRFAFMLRLFCALRPRTTFRGGISFTIMSIFRQFMLSSGSDV